MRPDSCTVALVGGALIADRDHGKRSRSVMVEHVLDQLTVLIVSDADELLQVLRTHPLSDSVARPPRRSLTPTPRARTQAR